MAVNYMGGPNSLRRSLEHKKTQGLKYSHRADVDLEDDSGLSNFMASRAGPSDLNQPQTRHLHTSISTALPPTTPDRRQAASELLMKDDLSTEAVRCLRSARHRKKRRFLEPDRSPSSSDDQLDLIASLPRRGPVHTRWPDSHSEDQLALSEPDPGPRKGISKERAFVREGTPAPSQGLTYHSDPPPPFLEKYERYRVSLKGLFTEDEPHLKASYYGEVNNSPHLDYGEPYSPRGHVLSSPSSSSRSTSCCTPPQCYSPLALPLADQVGREPGPTLSPPAVPPDLLHVEEQLQARRQALYDKMPW